MVLKYQSGKEIKNGDQVLFHGNGAEVEFVACDPGGPATDWFVHEFGGGVMISDPKVSGHTFIPVAFLEDGVDLEFVCSKPR
jgi:hypothetical protein